MNCPVCNGLNIEKFLFIESIPTTQNLLYKTLSEAIAAPVADMDLRHCKNCSFIYNYIFSDTDVVYSGDYDNNQTYSEVFRSYINTQIDWLIKNHIKKNDTIVEIGCGKGYYIKQLLEKATHKGLKGGYGFDTSYVGHEYFESINLRYFKNYYNEEYKYIEPTIIICRHVIEHIMDPFDFLLPIGQSLNENGLLFLEMPNVNWILENNIIYDFFYEHCSYYNPYSISKLLNRAGFEIVEIKNEFQGQYMWVVAKKTDMISYKNGPVFKNKGGQHLGKMGLFEKTIKDKINKKWYEFKKTALWGAGAKGTNFVNLFDKKREFIKCLIDINVAKQNKYVSGTGHIVISPEDIYKYDINNVFVMNANYYREVKEALNDKSIDVETL